MKHIKYNYGIAYLRNEFRHAGEVMENLGITYQYCVPQSAGDQFWFWNCENVPDVLPDYISELKVDPFKYVGFGLTKEIAINIRDYRK